MIDDSRSFALVGAVLMVFGLFAPLFTAPVIGTITYFDNARTEALIILLLGLAAAFLAGTGRTRFCIIPGLAAFGVMIVTWIQARTALEDLRDDFGNGLTGEIGRALLDRAAEAVRPEWGWALLILGAAMIVFAGIRAWRAGSQ